MAAKIGTLAINIVSNHAKAIAGMQQVGGKAKQLQGTFSQAAGTLRSFAGSLAGIVSVSGAAAFAMSKVNEAFADMDRILKTSQNLEISTEALVGYEWAASQVGVEVGQLEGAFKKMTRQIYEAASGSKEADKGFEMLGLSAKALQAGGMEEAFKQVAQAISRIDDPTKRAAAAVAVFGKSGQNLMSLLMQGRSGIEQFRDEAEKLNLTFSAEEAAKVEAYNDAMDRMSKTFQAMAREHAPRLATALTAMLEAITPMLTRVTTIWANLATAMEKTAGLSMAHPLFALAGLAGVQVGEQRQGPRAGGGVEAGKKMFEETERQRQKEIAAQQLKETEKQTKELEGLALLMKDMPGLFPKGDKVTVKEASLL